MTITPHSNDTDGVLDESDGVPVIRFERWFGHSIDDVWAAITQPEQLAQWWLPFDAEIVLELEAGGRFEMRSLSDPSMVLDLRVLRVEPPVLFEHSHVDPGSVVRWELKPDGDGCTLLLSQTVPARVIAVERGYLVGLHHSLERLVATLAGQSIPWDWDRLDVHRERYHRHGLAGAGTGG
jgi:uncharacterized protein YndB with AHSA1/START domain